MDKTVDMCIKDTFTVHMKCKKKAIDIAFTKKTAEKSLLLFHMKHV